MEKEEKRKKVANAQSWSLLYHFYWDWAFYGDSVLLKNLSKDLNVRSNGVFSRWILYGWLEGKHELIYEHAVLRGR